MSRVRATARLQLHAGFTLDDAARQVEYYAALGISHLYLSPIWRAVPGSTHGYDVVDPTEVNPELGGERALRALADRARASGMGLVLDIVPNHMAAHADNRWWWDVLQHGRASPYAHWFDINWKAPLAGGALQLPILDRPLDAAIEDGVLRVEQEAGVAVLRHHEARLPLAPGTVPDAAPADLRGVIEAQAYRPLWWRLGDDRLNYRRFFTISSLVALQVHHDAVFDTVHRLPLAHRHGQRLRHARRCAPAVGGKDPGAGRGTAGVVGLRRHHRLRFHGPGLGLAARRVGRGAAGPAVAAGHGAHHVVQRGRTAGAR